MSAWVRCIQEPVSRGHMSSKTKSCQIMSCSNMKVYYPTRSQLCTCHDSIAVVTCADIWRDWINAIDIIIKYFQKIWIASSKTVCGMDLRKLSPVYNRIHSSVVSHVKIPDIKTNMHFDALNAVAILNILMFTNKLGNRKWWWGYII